jgi:hypothetical protein
MTWVDSFDWQAERLGKPVHEVGALYRLTRGAFDKVVDGGDGDEASGALVHGRVDKADVGAEGPLGVWRLVHDLDEGRVAIGADVRRTHVQRTDALAQRRIAGGENAARHGNEMRREAKAQRPGPGGHPVELLGDLWPVPMAVDGVGGGVLVGLTEMRGEREGAARAADTRLRVHDDVRLHEIIDPHGQQSQQRCGGIAARARHQAGGRDCFAVPLDKAVGGVFQQCGRRMLIAIPLRVEGRAPETEPGGEVYHTTPGGEQLWHGLDGSMVGQGDQDELGALDPLSKREIDSAQVGKDVSQGSAGLAPRSDFDELEGGVAGQQPQQLDAAVTGAIDHRDGDASGILHTYSLPWGMARRTHGMTGTIVRGRGLPRQLGAARASGQRPCGGARVLDVM